MSFSRSIVFEVLDRAVRRLSHPLKAMGRTLNSFGEKIQGDTMPTSMPLADTRNFSINSKSVSLTPSLKTFVAPSTVIAGDVQIAEDVGIFYLCKFLANVNSKITIGKGASIHDLVIIKSEEGSNVSLGENVTVCPNVFIANSTIGKNVYIGAGAKILDSVIGDGAIIAPGAVISGQKVGVKEVWAGAVGHKLRQVSAEEEEQTQELHAEFAKMNRILMSEESKTIEELKTDSANAITSNFEDGSDWDNQTFSVTAEMEELGYAVENEDVLDAQRRLDFIEWARFVQRYPQRRIRNMDLVHHQLPKHLNAHNPNFQALQQVQQTQSELPTSPDQSRIDRSTPFQIPHAKHRDRFE